MADTAAAHILCCMRRLMASRDMLLQGCFEMDRIRPVRRLKNCTLGLLGFGNISRNLAGKMKSFFGRILVSDPYFQGEAEYQLSTVIYNTGTVIAGIGRDLDPRAIVGVYEKYDLYRRIFSDEKGRGAGKYIKRRDY